MEKDKMQELYDKVLIAEDEVRKAKSMLDDAKYNLAKALTSNGAADCLTPNMSRLGHILGRRR